MQITTRLGRTVDVNADYTIDQNWSHYTAEDHDRWDRLHARQIDILQERACDEYLQGFDLLELSSAGIPNFEDLSARLMAATGWTVVAVPDLVPDDVFFDHLANRRFPAGNFIRSEAQFDYLQEPDVFHDVFGHVPLLANPVFAQYMEAYGKAGGRALRHDALTNLARLYWYTVEFGLINTRKGMRIYGAGILSSPQESVFSLEDQSPNRIGFDVSRIVRTEYRIDDFQQTYFVIESFDQLLKDSYADFGPLYASLKGDETLFSVDDVKSTDIIFNRGTQAYAKACGRTAIV